MTLFQREQRLQVHPYSAQFIIGHLPLVNEPDASLSF
jgi:hypothetical protein